MNPTDELEVYRGYMTLSNCRSCDADNFQVKPIKYVIDLITPPVVHTFNIALLRGEFLEDIKSAKVSVLFKEGHGNLMTNYRHISVLPLLSKRLEKNILRHLDTFLENRAAITDSQFGFPKQRLTNPAILL